MNQHLAGDASTSRANPIEKTRQNRMVVRALEEADARFRRSELNEFLVAAFVRRNSQRHREPCSYEPPQELEDLRHPRLVLILKERLLAEVMVDACLSGLLHEHHRHVDPEMSMHRKTRVVWL